MDFTTKAPGVYIEEITPAGPIAGVGTSTAALIGTVAGPPPDKELGKPRLITSWTAYTQRFGGYGSALTFPYAVRGFFENGGTRAYVVPVHDLTGLGEVLLELARVPEINLVCAPGATPDAQRTVVDHCELPDNQWFAVLDGVDAAENPDPDSSALKEQRTTLATDKGYAALYWPWIVVPSLDPAAPPPAPPNPAGAPQPQPTPSAPQPALLPVPPSGHIAGVMARCDNERGVHKAPANELVRGPVALTYSLTDTEQGGLNNINVNGIRSFPGRGTRVWGARTLTGETPWQFVNVRRLVTYIERSILDGVRWAVFEPNNIALWKGLERTITEFLTRVWESGALFGRTAAEAFYVKIDEELNPPDTRDLGRVVVEIGVAPTRPAEFVHVRLGLWSGGARLGED
ncbi:MULTISPECIES: phage tail sheath family protein [unclassified Streptomyces]|uniref:phage tail sheath family protein n=1 Tax=unclassified Streptomyces TaxID=2593676 RepID=UPI004041A189